MAGRDSEDRSGLFLGGLIALALVLVGGLIAFILVIAGRPASTQSIPPPYAFNLRPVPATNNVGVLLPPTVGPFTRRAINGNMSGNLTGLAQGAYNGSSKATDTVQVNIVREANVAQAQADVGSRGDQIAGTNKQKATTTGFSFVLSTDSHGGVRFIFASTFWLFDVTASSRDALDSFMKAYPY